MLALSVACTAAAVVWAYLILGHGGYWRTSQRLPPVQAPSPAEPARAAAEPSPAAAEAVRWPDVAAVIPARNEAAMLPVVLPALLGQDYPGALTVILVDDCSTDGTAGVAAALAPEPSRPGQPGRALRVLAGAPLPPGWAGKVWAMAQGLAHALAHAPAEARETGYVLFTDADIAWHQGALRDLVRAAEADDRDLVSQMALLRTATGWERVIVPAFVYFFAQLYPFGRVNSPRSRTAAAAGGCMLVRREALERSGGLAPIRGARIDDVALGQVIKGQRGRCWLGLSTDVVSVRPYPRLADLWQMVARSAYIQLRYSPWLLAGTVAGLAFIYLLPPAGAIAGLAALAASAAGAAGAVSAPAALAAAAGLAGWALMSLTYRPMLRLYRLSPLRAPGLPLIALLYTAMTVDSARRHYAGRGAEWKGRTDRARLGFPAWQIPT
ncbi:MAG TPA: glycosyltransferase [Streptosporangiaceae bacterium]|nr:glycosyltransferase [Streptosporangiaceae bacterium]